MPVAAGDPGHHLLELDAVPPRGGGGAWLGCQSPEARGKLAHKLILGPSLQVRWDRASAQAHTCDRMRHASGRAPMSPDGSVQHVRAGQHFGSGSGGDHRHSLLRYEQGPWPAHSVGCAHADREGPGWCFGSHACSGGHVHADVSHPPPEFSRESLIPSASHPPVPTCDPLLPLPAWNGAASQIVQRQHIARAVQCLPAGLPSSPWCRPCCKSQVSIHMMLASLAAHGNVSYPPLRTVGQPCKTSQDASPQVCHQHHGPSSGARER